MFKKYAKLRESGSEVSLLAWYELRKVRKLFPILKLPTEFILKFIFLLIYRLNVFRRALDAEMRQATRDGVVNNKAIEDL